MDQGINQNDITGTDFPSFAISAKSLIENDLVEIEWVWEKFIPSRGITIISGESDLGKSTLMRQFVLSVVSGETEFLGKKIFAPNRKAIYVSTEDDEYSISPRIKREVVFFPEETDYRNLVYIFDSEDILGKLGQVFAAGQYDCVVIDALGDLFEGDSNSATVTRNLLNEYKRFADKFSTCIIFIHHLRKSAPNSNKTKNDLLGSSAIQAKARSVLMLSSSINRTSRILQVVKGNYLPSEEKEVKYELTYTEGIFDQSTTKSGSSISTTEERITQIVYSLRKEGYTIRNITQQLQEMGIDISKTKVHKLTKNEPVPCPTTLGYMGQDNIGGS